jgi:pimeloyl-ACP methyl ester carboxylesterase
MGVYWRKGWQIIRLVCPVFLAACSGGSDSGASSVESSATWHEDCPADTMEERLVDLGEVRLNVACRGSGPTVLFLHGFPEFHYSWKSVMDELAGEYRLVAPDQRGYNLSDKPAEVEAYELPLLMQDMVELIPLVSSEPVLVVAHDWGGPVGWFLAHHPDAQVRGLLATNGPHPLRFAELIATDPEQQEASAYMDIFRSDAAEALLTPEVLAGFGFSDFLSEEDLAHYMEAWAQPGAITGGLNWYRANTLEADAIESAMTGLSPTISVPVSVMWGLDDDAVLAPNAEGLDVYASDLVVETFEGVDHWIEHRIPAEVARGVRELDARAQSAR